MDIRSAIVPNTFAEKLRMELVVDVMVTFNMAKSFKVHGHPLADRVLEMATTLNDLTSTCLALHMS